MEIDTPLKPWERFIVETDIGSEDGDAMVCGVYDTLTGRLRIVDSEYIEPSQRREL